MDPAKPDDSAKQPDEEQAPNSQPLNGDEQSEAADEQPAQKSETDDTVHNAPEIAEEDASKPGESAETDLDLGAGKAETSEAADEAPATGEPIGEGKPEIPASEEARPEGETQTSEVGDGQESSAEAPAAATVTQSAPKKPRKRLIMSVLLIVVGVILIAGGAAAAYFGVVVPNKPENVLKRAAANSLQSDQATFDGNLVVSGGEDNGFPATKADFVAKAGAEGASSAVINMTISGVDFSLDARTIEGNLYVRVGDLTTLESLITSTLGSLGSSSAQTALLEDLFDQASQLLSEQWIVFDSTLLASTDSECVVNATTFTNDDLEVLERQFSENPFLAINDHADEAVGGVQTTKFDVTVDHKEGMAFANGLDELSAVQSLEACGETVGQFDDELKPEELLADGATEMTVWVDKAEERIHKISLQDVTVDEASQTKLSLESLITYEEFTIEKPDGARPALQVWSDLQSLLLGGIGLSESAF